MYRWTNTGSLKTVAPARTTADCFVPSAYADQGTRSDMNAGAASNPATA